MHSYLRYQANFLNHWLTGTLNSHSTNTVLSSYLLSVAVQSFLIAFKKLTAFPTCYVPVSAFAFRLVGSLTELPILCVTNFTFTYTLSERTSPHQVSSEMGPLKSSSVSDVSSFFMKFQNFFIQFLPPLPDFDLQIFPLQKVL